MDSHDYLGLEIQQLMNENDTPYVSSRSRMNPFVHFGDGVDIEEIFEDEPHQPPPKKNKNFFQSSCSYIPMAKKALDIAERGCEFFGSGCRMCCGGCADCPYCGVASGGCAGCPYCSGVSGGVGSISTKFTKSGTDIMSTDFIQKHIVSAKDPMKAFFKAIMSRYGDNTNNKDEFDKFIKLSLTDKYLYFKNRDRRGKKEEQKEFVILHEEQEKKNIIQKLVDFVKNSSVSKVIDFITNNEVNENLRKITKGLLQEKLEKENKKEAEKIASIKPTTEREASILDTAKAILRTVQGRAPLPEIKKITTKTQAEQAKEEIKETYAQCLQRFPPGEKRKNCMHLTKPFIQRKLLLIELQKYKSYADCMADKEIPKGHRRETCHKFTKGFRRENPDLFEQETVSVTPPQEGEILPPKYKTYAECMADKEIPIGTKRKTCHPYAMSAKRKQKESTIKRNEKIRKKAVQLRKTHPNKTYAERIKMARKQIKGGEMEIEI